MQVPGICFICGREARPAYSCMLCGSIICQKDFLPEKGLCKRCSRPARTE